MTNGTWDLLLMAVHPNYQTKGIGNKMLNFIKRQLSNDRQRISIVKTALKTLVAYVPILLAIIEVYKR